MAANAMRCSLRLAAALLLMAAAPAWGQAGDAELALDVCPAGAPHRALPFLKLARTPPGALSDLLGGGLGTSVDTAAISDFAKRTLVPMLGANVVFFAIALLFVLIFITWRLLRFCCHIICCRASCDARRAERNPHVLLFGRGMKITQGFMVIFGLTCVAFAVYGMATVKKGVVGDAFGVLDTLTNFTDGVLDSADRLLITIDGVSGVIDDFQSIVINDIDVDGLTANLTAVGDFLDAVAPPGILAAVGQLENAVNVGLEGPTGTLAALRSGITAFATAQADLDTRLATLAAAPAELTTMRGALGDMQTRLASLPWSNALVGTVSNAAGGPMALLSAALAAMDTATWSTTLAASGAALDYVAALRTPASNPYTVLKARVLDVTAAVSDVQSRISSLTASIGALPTQHENVQPVITGLLAKLASINATILALTGDMQAAYGKLDDANDQMSTLLATNPGTQAASLATFSTSMTPTGPLTALAAALTSAESELNSFGSTTLRNWLTSTSALLSAPAIATFKGHVSLFMTTPSQANWEAMSSHTADGSADGSFTGFQAAADALYLPAGPTGAFAGAVVDTIAPSVASDASDLQTAGAAAAAATTAADGYAVAAGTQALPDLTALKANLATAATSFSTLGTPYSSVVAGPVQDLQDIRSAAIEQGNSVKASINETTGGVRDSLDGVRNSISGKLQDASSQYKPLATRVDGYRYAGSLGVYGASILFVVLLGTAAAGNYHFGANFSTLWLLLVTVVYFLLALIIAALVTTLHLGCGELESVLLDLAPTAYVPLLRYYFEGTGGNVSAVLRAADIMDVDQVLAQVTASQQDVLQSLTGAYTFRAAPLAVLNSLNGTTADVRSGVTGLLGSFDRDALLPIYTDVKGLVCCAVPDAVASMWTALTFSGVFGFALVFASFFFIGRIDRAPRRDCCGCTCHTQSKYRGTVYPDALPTYAAPGYDAPAYEAPTQLNGAMWSDGAGEAHVVVQAPGGAAAGVKPF